MVVVDLRNHGKSAEIAGLSQPPNSIGSVARDLADLVKSRGWDWPDVLIGHTMGGKVALDFAQSCVRGNYGEHVRLPKQLLVLDSVPGKVNPENNDGQVEQVLQTLRNLPSSIPFRNDVLVRMELLDGISAKKFAVVLSCCASHDNNALRL